jgi:hypothetical protein
MRVGKITTDRTATEMQLRCQVRSSHSEIWDEVDTLSNSGINKSSIFSLCLCLWSNEGNLEFLGVPFFHQRVSLPYFLPSTHYAQLYRDLATLVIAKHTTSLITKSFLSFESGKNCKLRKDHPASGNPANCAAKKLSAVSATK